MRDHFGIFGCSTFNICVDKEEGHITRVPQESLVLNFSWQSHTHG